MLHVYLEEVDRFEEKKWLKVLGVCVCVCATWLCGAVVEVEGVSGGDGADVRV